MCINTHNIVVYHVLKVNKLAVINLLTFSTRLLPIKEFTEMCVHSHFYLIR